MYYRIIFFLFLFINNFTYAEEEYIFPSQMNEEFESNNKDKTDNDPFEFFNRKIFIFNHYLEKSLIRPITVIYDRNLPNFVQSGISNVLNNLTIPLTMVNSAIMGEFKNFANSFWKFTLNTSLGIGGLYKFSDLANIQSNNYKFNDTLDHYGLSSGPYIVLPVIGPSSLRDAIGTSTDIVIDPVNHLFNKNSNYTRLGFTILDRYSDKIKYIDNIENNSIDAYSTIRSLYLQNKGLSKQK